MTIEVRLAEQRIRHKVGDFDKVIRKKNRRCKKRPKRSAVPEVSTALQRLFLSCRDVFRGPGTVPSPTDVKKLCHILDGMMPEDVGLSRDLQFFKPKTAVKDPRVTYTTIYKCEKFSLCIFFLPATAVIPLHNHPGMTVFSKLLLGTMHIKAYDLVDPVNSEEDSQLKLARLTADSVFTAPCNTSVLYPTSGGNIHAFTAITPCAVLDVIGPPYSKEDGRDCSYYKDTLTLHYQVCWRIRITNVSSPHLTSPHLIRSVTVAYNKDPSPVKLNLGVGAYRTECALSETSWRIRILPSWDKL